MSEPRGFVLCFSGGVGGDSEGLQAASDLLKIQISGENMRVIVLLCDGR